MASSKGCAPYVTVAGAPIDLEVGTRPGLHAPVVDRARVTARLDGSGELDAESGRRGEVAPQRHRHDLVAFDVQHQGRTAHEWGERAHVQRGALGARAAA